MRWLKWASWTFLTLIVLLVLIPASLVLTDTGNKWLWHQATHYVAGLSGTLDSGNVVDGWHFSRFGWHSGGVDVDIKDLALHVTAPALVHGKVHVQSLSASMVKVKVTSSQDSSQAATDSSPAGDFTLPVTAEVDDMDISNIDVLVDGTHIAAGHFGMEGLWNKQGLDINGIAVDGLAITVPASAPAATTQTPAAKTAAAISLPTVSLPFAVDLESLVLENSRFDIAGQKQALALVTLDAQMQGSQVTINKLEVDHQLASVTGSGKVTLSGKYPLSLKVVATLKKALMDGQLNGENLSLNANGSVANLAFNIKGKGPVAASLEGALQPLEPTLPFDVVLDWPQLGWPLQQPQYQLQTGTLTAKGSLNQYQLALHTQGQGPQIPPTTIDLNASGDSHQLSISQLSLAMEKGKALVNGQLNWQQGLVWNGTLNLDNFDPGFWAPQLKGAVSGQLPSRFALNGEKWQLTARPDLKGTLANQSLAVTGAVALNQALHGNVDLQVKNGDNSLSAKGSLSQQLAIKGKLLANNLGLYGVGVQGALQGQWALTGTVDKPHVTLALSSQGVSYQDIQTQGLSVDADATLTANPEGKVSVKLAHLNQGDISVNDLAVNASGSAADHKLTLAFKGDPVGGSLRLTGHLNGENWQGELAKAEFTTPLKNWQLQKAVRLGFKQQTFTASAHCWTSQPASLCIDAINANAKGGSAGLHLKDLNLARLQPFLPDNFHWQAVLSGDATASWQGTKPQLKAHFQTTAGQFVSGKEDVGYQALTLSAQLDDKALTSNLNFRSDALGTLNLDAKVTDPQQSRTLSGNLAIKHFTLGWLAPLIPEVYSLTGEINGEGRLAGSLNQPLFYGKLALTGGGVNTNSDMVTISDFNTALDIKGTAAELSGSAKLGKGDLKLSGNMDWTKMPISGEINVKGNNLEAGYPGYGDLKVSPDLTLALGKETRLEGQVEVPWARIKVKELPKSAVSTSKDVVVITSNPDLKPQQASAPFAMHVGVKLGKDVRLEAMGLKTRLEGGLMINQDPNKAMRGNGEIKLVDGIYKAYGQNLVINTGSILFNGALDSPNLNIEAIRNKNTLSDSSITVGVKVTGDAANPKVELYSDPDMQQSEQLSYLLRGKGLDSTEGTSGNAVMQAMLLSAGINQFGGAVTGVAETLGLSDVAIDTSSTTDGGTQVAISGYLAPGLQLEYGVGVFNSVGQVKLRYELLPRLYLQAVNGVNQALDLFYKFEF
ncbi:autotransporter assembly complex protein TamB [Gallaecimonas mangrovi]|uniref:autotransporter assembly complex protein TamB n=1 Tax=Gallaecimonas mangrovi TaxID=2291597 RepID=UPI000E204FA8|nr:translocation/assembly module TamB domain-containing protein [Gallaecimonas mangrovi]